VMRFFEARLVRKYGGLKWFDPDENAKFSQHIQLRCISRRSGGTIST
jgi:hypothetical protein